MTLDPTRAVATGSAGSSTLTISGIKPTGAVFTVTGGQRVLIIQSQGTGAGAFEIRTTTAATPVALTLDAPLSNTYGAGAQAILIRQYTTVSIPAGSTLTGMAWDGSTGGVLPFEATGGVTVAGTLTMSATGFRGATHSASCGYHCTVGTSGESYLGVGAISQAANGSGGGGGAQGQDCGMGAGGGYAGAGGTGINNTTGTCRVAGAPNSSGGTAVGAADLSTMYFGGAGGEGGADEDGRYPGPGGNGGGILWIRAASIDATLGVISDNGGLGGNGVQTGCPGNGGCGESGGGGGAGGAVRLVANTVALAATHLTSSGAIGGTCTCGATNSGAGSVGRIAIRASYVTGTSAPAYTPL